MTCEWYSTESLRARVSVTVSRAHAENFESSDGRPVAVRAAATRHVSSFFAQLAKRDARSAPLLLHSSQSVALKGCDET